MSQSSQETVIVRDDNGLRRMQSADDWTTITLLGALSADPRSFDELARAWLRYRPEEPLEDLPWIDGDDEPGSGPWLLLDMACLRIVAGDGATLPENPGEFQRDEGPWNPDVPLVWINHPPEWTCIENAEWKAPLLPLPVPCEPLDVRGVLFGRALAAGIARRTLEITRGERLPGECFRWYDIPWDAQPSDSRREAASAWRALTIRVHADWLLAPRDDLEGQPPRTFLHRGRDWVDHELHNREQQWSHFRCPPQPLDLDTFAYRHGPLGRHEVVMYFDLCREVIDAAWDRIVETPDVDEAELTPWLHDFAQWWLTEGSIDGDPTPPAVIIESERRRLPLVGGASHLDCDCPICRMMADGDFGPMFQGFDGHHLELDDEFAFSLCATREEWEKEQNDYRRFSEKMAAERRERETDGDEPAESVWTSSYVDEEAIGELGPSSPLSMMALAMRMGELVGDLKSAAADGGLIDALNESFDAYRDVDDDPVVVASAKTGLVEALEQIAAAQPGLTAKAADFQGRLDERERKSDLDFPF